MFKKYYIYKIIVYLIVSIYLLVNCQRKSHEMNPGIKVHFNKLNIFWNGTNRITGGVPMLENTNLKCHEVHTVEKDTNFTFEFLHNFEDHVEIKAIISPVRNSIVFYLSPNNYHTQKASDFVGILFEKLPEIESIKAFKTGTSTEANDVLNVKNSTEFLVLKYKDGIYGALFPLKGKGYDGSIGIYQNRFGIKSYHTVDGHNENDIPIAILVFGNNTKQIINTLSLEPLIKTSISNLELNF